MARAKQAGIEVMMLTVDSITGGNRERDKRTGFSIPFPAHPRRDDPVRHEAGLGDQTMSRTRASSSRNLMATWIWAAGHSLSAATSPRCSIPSLSWDDVAAMVREWGGQFCLKGVMSVEDAKRAVDIGCTGIILSNHGGRQLDGSRTAFDQLAEIVDAVGDRIDVIMDGGVQRGTHVLKALSVGAKAVGLGRYYLFPSPRLVRPASSAH